MQAVEDHFQPLMIYYLLKLTLTKAGMKYHVDLHARVDGAISVKEGHDLSHKLKDTLREEIPELGQVLIHIEPN